MIREYICRCGKKVVFNDDKLQASHEVPECKWFVEAVRNTGGSEGTLVVADEKTGLPPGWEPPS